MATGQVTQPVQAALLRGRLGRDARSSVAAPERDAEGGQGSVWVAGVAAQRGGGVDRPRLVQHPDDQVAQRRHDVRAAAAADLGGVLGEGYVAEVVQRLDGPVPAQQGGQPGRAGLTA